MSKSKSEKGNAGCGCMIVVVGLLALVVIVGAKGCGGVYSDYSTGERSGRLHKISKKGLLCKSWEGQILINDLGGMNPKENFWEFSCMDDSLGKQMEDLSGKRVKISYRQWLIGPWYQNTPYTVTAIEEVK